MKKVLVILALVAMTGIASAELLSNNSFETYADDGYGRIMPVGYGLYTDSWNWGNIDPVGTAITTADAHTGSASMQLDDPDGANVVLTGGVGDLPGTGEDYILTAWVKTDSGVLGSFGASMFAPGYGPWWWGGGIALPDTGGAWQQISYSINVGAPSAWNLEVTAFPGSSNILVDDVSFALVPEPTTMALLALGGLFLRRKK